MTKTKLEKIIYSFHHPRSVANGKRVRSRESLTDYITRYVQEMESGERLNIHKLRYGLSTIKNYKGFIVQFDEFCMAKHKRYDFGDIDYYNPKKLSKVASKVASKESKKSMRLSKDALYKEILGVCAEYTSLEDIAIAIDKKLSYLKNKVIPRMVEQGLLERKYPDNPKHSDQQYRAKKTE